VLGQEMASITGKKQQDAASLAGNEQIISQLRRQYREISLIIAAERRRCTALTTWADHSMTGLAWTFSFAIAAAAVDTAKFLPR
jgi:hypothetical protein